MRGAHDPLTRGPGLDVAGRAARLRQSPPHASTALAALVRDDVASAVDALNGLWRRDPSVWSSDPTVQRSIANRLGWLTAPSATADDLERIHSFAARIRQT